MANKFTIGRDPGCDISLQDGSVSRVHAEFSVLDNGHVEITDRNSTNGIVILENGVPRRVGHACLKETDQVQFGAVMLKVRQLVDPVRDRIGTMKFAAPAMRSQPSPAQQIQPAQEQRRSSPDPNRLVRCPCGAIKKAADRCAACGS